MQPSIFNHGAVIRALQPCGSHPCRTYDYENFVWLVQLPKVWMLLHTVFLLRKRLPAWMVALVPPSNLQETRAAVMALRAFNVETALVADSVKEAALAQIRMQWWRDAVDSLYGPKPQPHPVIQALKQVRKPTGSPASYTLLLAG